MAKKAQNQHNAAPTEPRLYLVTPPLADPAGIAGVLPDLLVAADIAAVLVRLAPGDERAQINRVKALTPIVQSRDVALIVDGHPEIVARAGADGCHLSGVDAVQAAAPLIKPDRILGAAGLASRDDAMTAGEIADYVMFGEPAPDGARPSFQAIVERIEWWSEVFQVPCVAWAETLSEIERLCAAGADFVAVSDLVFAEPAKSKAMLSEIDDLLIARTPA